MDSSGSTARGTPARRTTSLTPYLLEETYEAVEALRRGDQAAVREELGDVLLQVMFHARVAQERTDGTGYTIDDVADGIIAKLTRRHPHVFGDVRCPVRTRSSRTGTRSRRPSGRPPARAALGVLSLDGVPLSQPALSLAAPVAAPGRASAACAAPTWPRCPRSRREPCRAGAADRGDRPIGADLFALVAKARAAGLDPELELRAAALLTRPGTRLGSRTDEPGQAGPAPTALAKTGPLAAQSRRAQVATTTQQSHDKRVASCAGTACRLTGGRALY